MTALLYTIWIFYTVGSMFFLLFWGTLFWMLVKDNKKSEDKKDKRELLID